MKARARLAAPLLAGLTALTALLASCGSPAETTPNAFHGARLGNPWELPATKLVDTRGEAWSFTEDDAEPLRLVFFGYTNCPDICSQEMADITSALARLDDEQREQVEVVFVTTDPARDDEAALTRYLGAFDPAYVGLTGSGERVQEMIDAFHLLVEHGKKDTAGQYMVTHDDHTFAVTADEQVVALWNRDVTSQQLAEDIDRLLEESA